MSGRYLNIVGQALDLNGDPIGGAKLYFYEAGTTTFANTYSDEDLTAPNANPVIADGEGRFGDIWLQDIEYRVQFTDANDVLIDDQDPVVNIGMFKLDAPGSVSRPISSKLSDIVSVKDFDAVGDGVTDDSVAFQAAGDASGSVYIPTGTYVIKSALSFTAAVRFFGDGEATIIDATDAAFSGSYVFNFTGSITQIEELGANATVGDRTVTFASAPSLSVGDVFVIYNPTASSWSGFRAEYNAGEYCEVAEIVGSVVTLKNPLYDSYTIAAVDVYKHNGISPIIENMVINGDVSTGLIKGEFCQQPRFSNLYLEHSNNSLISLSKSYDGDIENISGNNVGDGGDDYGIVIGNSQDIRISNSDVYARRHAVATGGDANIGNVPCRNIRTRSSTLKNKQDGSIHCADFHGNTEDSSYENCTIYGGATWQGKNNGYKDCTIHSRDDGVVISSAEILGGKHYAHNCKLISYTLPSSRGLVDIGGSSTAVDANTNETSVFQVSGCEIYGRNMSGALAVVRFVNRGSTQSMNFDVQDILLDVNNINSVLFTDLASGTAASDYVIVDNITSALTGKLLCNHTGSHYLNFPHRCMTQTGRDSVTTAASADAVGVMKTFKWAYPRIPNAVCTRSPQNSTAVGRINGFIGVVYAYDLELSRIQMIFGTESSADAFTAGTNVDLHYVVGLSEV